MSISLERVNDNNQKEYNRLFHISAELLLNPQLIIVGVKQDQHLFGVIIVERKSDKGIILDFKFNGTFDKIIGNSIIEQLEVFLNKIGLEYVFYFHSDEDMLKEILNSRSWYMNESQTEYTINPSKMKVKTTIPVLLHGFNVICFEKIDTQTLNHLILEINKQVNRDVDILPPIDSINRSTSYFLISGGNIIGWFISTINVDRKTLSISRLFISSEFRGLKVTLPFLKYVLYDIYRTDRYENITFNIVSNHRKLINIINKGYIGDIINSRRIYKSYKKLKEKF